MCILLQVYKKKLYNYGNNFSIMMYFWNINDDVYDEFQECFSLLAEAGSVRINQILP